MTFDLEGLVALWARWRDAAGDALEGLGEPAALAAVALATCVVCVLMVGVALLALRRSSRAQLAVAREQLSDSFRAAAADALQHNNEGFLTLAAQRFEALQKEADTDLSGRQHAIDSLVGPLRETLQTYQSESRAFEAQRSADAGRVGEQLRTLSAETARLSQALRSPNARGRWGEVTLRRTAELAGLSQHCDFDEQVTLDGDGDRARPDMLVRLPGERAILIDAKVPLAAYLDACELADESAREQALDRHAVQVKRHVDTLAARDYPARLASATEFTVLFLPSDAFLAAAVERKRELVEYALDRDVVLATPATFYALLVAVERGWRQQRLSDNAERVFALGREMDERLAGFSEHLTRLGGSLDKSVAHFNTAVGSFDTRVLAQARRLRELGVVGRKELRSAPAVDARTRSLRP